MKHNLKTDLVAGVFMSWGLLSSLAWPLTAAAASLTFANAPLATSTATVVKPNLYFILDDSGSMDSAYLPDSVKNNDSMHCYRNNYYNGVYYSPDLTYPVPVKADGTNYAASSFTAAQNDGYSTATTPTTTNLSSNFTAGNDNTGQAAYYYKYTGTSPATPVRGTCYPDTSYTMVTVSATSGPGGTDERTNFANWYSYYRTRLLMMKTAAGLAFKGIGSSYRVGYSTIGYTGTDSSDTNTAFLNIADFDATQKGKWYKKVYGTYTTNATPLRGALSKAGRLYGGKLLTGANDPVQYSCQQNFTLLSTDGYWNTNDEVTTGVASADYGPYQLDNVTLVGNPDGTESATPRPVYDGSVAGNTWTLTWTRDNYSGSSSGCSNNKVKLKTQPEKGTCTVTSATATCTPCQSCWSNNGQSYTSGSCVSTLTYPGGSDPSVPVQQGSAVQSTSGGGSNTLADVALYYYQTDLRTPTLNNCTGSIAGENLCTNNVFISATDSNQQQHMTTFTLGLGADGRMIYSSSYMNDSFGDYYNVKLGSAASTAPCTWDATDTLCDWPSPGSGKVENIDDLWHAAVNGRGAYFSAKEPTQLVSGFANTLASINAKRGSAAAAATSTLNPIAGNNLAFVASYTTVKWQGNLEGRGINIDTGAVNTNADWCVEDVVAGTCISPSSFVADTSGATTTYYCSTPNAVVCTGGKMVGADCWVPVATACSGTLKSKVLDASDTRTIYTANDTGTALTAFDATYAAAHTSYFDATHIGTLSQWSTLTATQRTTAAGSNLLNYLRGRYQYEDRPANAASDRLYRYRESVMGDAVESQPTFVAGPVFSYTYSGYSAYATAQASRAGTVFVGTNDGMLHAFVSQTNSTIPEVGGTERWAYVPSMVIPNLWKLADFNYATNHSNYENGSPITSDVYCTADCGGTGGAASWRTILVSGLNAGGRGYFALDITNPNSPTLLWEFTPTAGIGKIRDNDVGYGFGKPIITRKADGTWVVLVASGYNNANPDGVTADSGNGQGYLFVLNAYTGTVISKIGTGVGSIATPSGLGRIAAWNTAAAGYGNEASYVYGGDLKGNVWRFDLNAGTVMKFATLYSDAAGANPQPITTAPVLGKIKNKRVVFIGTGKYLETSDLSTTQTQSYYAMLDDNATATFVNPRNALVNQTLTNNPDATRSSTNNPVSFTGGARGWYVDFPDSGERLNIDSRLVQGVIVAPTVVPSNTACSPGGYSWKNYFCYETGATGGMCGVSNKSDSVVVGFNIVYVNGKPIISYVNSNNPTPTKEDDAYAPKRWGNIVGTFNRHRAEWRELH